MAHFKTIQIYCTGCNSLLYAYHKAGSGLLVKCYRERIKEDYTRGDLRCPKCGAEFARERMIHGKPAHKIIQGKVYVKS
jgi:DNA-directed RNA polymerase subunit M/transcription elongation factor TFIIS